MDMSGICEDLVTEKHKLNLVTGRSLGTIYLTYIVFCRDFNLLSVAWKPCHIFASIPNQDKIQDLQPSCKSFGIKCKKCKIITLTEYSMLYQLGNFFYIERGITLKQQKNEPPFYHLNRNNV